MADHSTAITEHPGADHGHGHAGPGDKLYLIVFAILCVCTLVSFLVYDKNHQNLWPLYIIMAVAVLKATLVCTYFMHLKWDWRLVYFIMVPVVILAVMMIIILLPDAVIAWQPGHYYYDDTPHVTLTDGHH